MEMRNKQQLMEHLCRNDFETGRHSDITIHAFNETYALHRFIIDRCPFFATAFSGNWTESSAKEITLHPEEADGNITKSALEHVLQYLYGVDISDELDADAVGLFVTSKWLGMEELAGFCTKTIQRCVNLLNAVPILNLVTENYYGAHGETIATAAKTLLCNQGSTIWRMVWDEVPCDILREIVGGDSFFCPTELERWEYAVKLLDRRLLRNAMEWDLVDEKGNLINSVPSALQTNYIPLDDSFTVDCEHSKLHQRWLKLYMDEDILPLRVMLNEDIRYMHIPFENLKAISRYRDIFGVRAVNVGALAAAIRLSLRLNMQVNITDEFKSALNPPEEDADSEFSTQLEDLFGLFGAEGHQLHETFVPQEFSVPNQDSLATYAEVLGKETNRIHDASPEDLTCRHVKSNHLRGWKRGDSFIPAESVKVPGPSQLHSSFPPFRCSASFPNPKRIGLGERVHSSPFWYAGATWGIFLQSKLVDGESVLGLFLHRVYDTRDTAESLASWVDKLGPRPVDCDDTVENSPATTRRDILKSARHILEEPKTFAGVYYCPWPKRLKTPILERQRSPAGPVHEYGTSTSLPYVDCRSCVTVYFKFYSNFDFGTELSCFESKPVQFHIDECWGWNVQPCDFKQPITGWSITEDVIDPEFHVSCVLGMFVSHSNQFPC